MLLGFGGWGKSYIMILIQTAILIAIAALYFRSFDRLRKRQNSGWVYVFYAGLLGLVSHLLDGNIIGAILGFVVGMYVIFQVKDQYHS